MLASAFSIGVAIFTKKIKPNLTQLSFRAGNQLLAAALSIR
jgi:hypothetical protein